jgi:hypothetical protein
VGQPTGRGLGIVGRTGSTRVLRLRHPVSSSSGQSST